MGAKPVTPDSPELDPESGTTRVVADAQVKAFPPDPARAFFANQDVSQERSVTSEHKDAGTGFALFPWQESALAPDIRVGVSWMAE